MQSFLLSLSDFKITTIIGILPIERENPQEIILNIKLSYDANREIVDYGLLRLMVLEIFKTNHFLYLEDALRYILDSILKRFKEINEASLSLAKVNIFKDCIPSISLMWRRDD